MLNILLDALIIFLMLYALCSISAKIAEFATKKDKCKNLHVTLKPQDTENLEYVIRHAASKCDRLGIGLIIIDDELSENSKFIITSLANEYSNITIWAKDEYIKNFL